MQTTEVSVIIPIYNAEQYLKRCLDSICGQTLRNIEIICINDASTDKSLNILNEYAEKDNRIKLVNLEHNQGESIARNTGLAMAKGEYIGFVDNDDMLDPDFYEKLYLKAKETNADIAKGEVLEIDYDGKEHYGKINKKILENNNKMYFVINWWTAIFRKSLIIENNIDFPKEFSLGGDIVFLNRCVLSAQKVVTVNDVLYHYYRREDSGDSKVLSSEKIKSVLRAYEIILDNVNSANASDINEDGYNYVFYYLASAIINLSFRSKEHECKRTCAETIIKLYDKCKHQSILNKRLSIEYLSLCKSLSEGDVEDLTNFFVTCNTLTRLLAANLRYRVKNNFACEKHIPIFLSSDDNYAPFVATTVASICHNTKSFIDFYILDSGISEENKRLIETLKEKFNNFSIEFIKANIGKYFENLEFKDAHYYLTLATYNRFLIPKLKENLNKAIYLDIDIIVLGDIAEIYGEDLENYALGAVWEEYTENHENIQRKQYLNLSNDHKYFNAGVLLINCKKWREENLTVKLFETEKNHREKLKFEDQDVMNKFFDNNYKMLHSKYNYLNQSYGFYDKNEVLVRHFNGYIKPWHLKIEERFTRFLKDIDLFWYYARMTPFFERLDKDCRNEEKQDKFLRQLRITAIYKNLLENRPECKLFQ